LGRIPVEYWRCTSCGTVFLPNPHWLDEAYGAAISELDVGLLDRCLRLARITEGLARSERLRDERFLDWGGGYGTLTRLLRDKGLDFRHADPLCQNIFAAGLEGDLARRYALITAFEVLEHLDRPLTSLAPVFAAAERLLVSTYVLPDPAPSPDEWWYYARESGQHVTFYTPRALAILGERFGTHLTSDGEKLHLFHRAPLRARTRWLLSPRARTVDRALTDLKGRLLGASSSLQAIDGEMALSRLEAGRSAGGASSAPADGRGGDVPQPAREVAGADHAEGASGCQDEGSRSR
jgi:hypothetical protein